MVDGYPICKTRLGIEIEEDTEYYINYGDNENHDTNHTIEADDEDMQVQGDQIDLYSNEEKEDNEVDNINEEKGDNEIGSIFEDKNENDEAYESEAQIKDIERAELKNDVIENETMEKKDDEVNITNNIRRSGREQKMTSRYIPSFEGKRYQYEGSKTESEQYTMIREINELGTVSEKQVIKVLKIERCHVYTDASKDWNKETWASCTSCNVKGIKATE